MKLIVFNTMIASSLLLFLKYFCKCSRLSKVYNKLRKMRGALSYFTERVWEFQTENITSLWESMTSEDKDKFHFDMGDVDMQEYFYISKLGVRYFYLKEKMESIPTTQPKNTW